MGASFLALLAAYPAFAADVKAETKANAEVSTGQQIENSLEKTGDAISNAARKTGETIDEKTEAAGAAVKEKYTDMKAYFTDDKDVKVVSKLDMVNHLTADALIGADVQNPKGEDIGDVQDILVSADGDAEMVIINDGGILGLGGKLAAFDYDVIEGMDSNQDVVVKLTEASIEKAKAFDPDKIPANLYSVNKIVGSKVVDEKGKAVAKVETVAFEGDDADYLIVSFDKILGVGGERAALDFDALAMSNNQGKYTFKLNSQQTAQFENYKEAPKAY